MFKEWAKHKVKSYIYCVNQFLREKRHKKWNQECKQKQSLLFNFCNIFGLLTSRTENIAWWPPVFNPDFYIFSYNGQLRKIQRNVFDTIQYYHTFLSSLYVLKTKQGLKFYRKKDKDPIITIENHPSCSKRVSIMCR